MSPKRYRWEVCGEQSRDLAIRYDPWDNDIDNRRETVLCRAHHAEVFESREYEQGLINVIRFHENNLNEYIKYCDDFQNEILDKVKRRYHNNNRREALEVKNECPSAQAEREKQ
jgi:hypothetical protein